MPLKATFSKYTLKFKFDAGTSRGILREKDTWFLKVFSDDNTIGYGIGECGPLKGLSPDDRSDFEDYLLKVCDNITAYDIPQSEADIIEMINDVVSPVFPSIRFGLETALYDLKSKGEKIVIQSPFVSDQKGIPINGLVWMGDIETMLKRVEEKISEGFDCIKLKIGALNFEEECKILSYIRDRFDANEITLRVDANGAFAPEEAMSKLNRLANYHVHSIEQPIKPGQQDMMARLCEESPVPIALDEELIGISGQDKKRALLEWIKPHYVILKPTLVGGLHASREWIHLAEAQGIGWWITSALESNIGLSAISQFTAALNVTMPQGLGTGQLYHNNIGSPLKIENGYLYYEKDALWGDVPDI